MEKSTQTGTPVQFMKWVDNKWIIYPAIISKVKNADVDIVAFMNGSTLHLHGLSHEDFRKNGEDYWRFIPNSLGGTVTIDHEFPTNRDV